MTTVARSNELVSEPVQDIPSAAELDSLLVEEIDVTEADVMELTVTPDAPTVAAEPTTDPIVEAADAAPVESPTRHHMLRDAVNLVYREMMKFGAVGAAAFVVDLGVYNLLRTGLWPLDVAPLAGKPLLAKVISVALATVVAWLGNRYWTFRHRRRVGMRREFVLFATMNIGGLLISLGCLWFSHYALGLTSALADNVSGNFVGLVLGTLFRFWAYRRLVFTDDSRPTQSAD